MNFFPVSSSHTIRYCYCLYDTLLLLFIRYVIAIVFIFTLLVL